MLDPGIVQEAQTEPLRDEAKSAFAIFVVDDNACTRCSVCVERCPSDCLYYARLPEDGGGHRTMAAVPMSHERDGPVEFERTRAPFVLVDRTPQPPNHRSTLDCRYI